MGVDFTVEICLIAVHMLVLPQWGGILVWIATKFYKSILAFSNFVKWKSIIFFSFWISKQPPTIYKSFWKSGKRSLVLFSRQWRWKESSICAMFLAVLCLVSHQPSINNLIHRTGFPSAWEREAVIASDLYLALELRLSPRILGNLPSSKAKVTTPTWKALYYAKDWRGLSPEFNRFTSPLLNYKT